MARAHYRIIWAALTGICHLPIPQHEVACVISVVRVSGTIRKVEEYAVTVAKDTIRRVKGSLEDGSGLHENIRAADMEVESENETESEGEILEEVNEEEMEVDSDSG